MRPEGGKKQIGRYLGEKRLSKKKGDVR